MKISKNNIFLIFLCIFAIVIKYKDMIKGQAIIKIDNGFVNMAGCVYALDDFFTKVVESKQKAENPFKNMRVKKSVAHLCFLNPSLNKRMCFGSINNNAKKLVKEKGHDQYFIFEDLHNRLVSAGRYLLHPEYTKYVYKVKE